MPCNPSYFRKKFKEEIASQFDAKMGKKDDDVVVDDDSIEVVEVDGE